MPHLIILYDEKERIEKVSRAAHCCLGHHDMDGMQQQQSF